MSEINALRANGQAYNTRTAWVAPDGYGVSIEPVAGFYKHKMRSGTHPVGVRIWFGQPLDPETREPLDRSLRWQATANGRDIELDHVWPVCGGTPITQGEHDYLKSVQDWGEHHAPNSPQANPNQRINLLTAPFTI